MWKDRKLHQQADGGGGGDSAPDELTAGENPGISAEELSKMREQIEAANRRAEEAARENDNLKTWLSTLTAGYDSSDQTRSRHREEPTEPEPDWDDMSERERMAYLEKRSEKRMREMLEEYISPLNQALSQRVQQDDSRWASSERERALKELHDAGISEVTPEEIDQYMKENNISPEVQAKPGVYRTTAELLLGRKVMEQRRAEAQRAPNLPHGTSYTPETSSAMSKEELEFLRSHGIEVSEEDWKELRKDDSPFAIYPGGEGR